MTKEQSNSKKLVKNTALMYFRMLFLMLISLYTARVVLEQLGVENYGIYNVVGSVVALFTSLRSLFAASTQRFLNYEMGKNNTSNLQLIFNLSSILNALIALVFFILAEIAGLWFISSEMNVDPERLFATRCVFQMSVITTVITILNVPFDASIVAHERMDFYAYLSIFEGIARLGICYLLSISNFDKLILYGFLVLFVTIVVQVINVIFCRRNFQECHYKFLWDKQYFKKMTNYAGWAFFGNTSYAFAQSGLNMVLNIFGGPAVNAARGIVYQVSNTLWGFITNLVVVIKPHVVKTYVSGNKDKALEISYMTSKLYFFIQLVLVVCIMFILKEILMLWLGQIIEYVEIFMLFVLLQFLVKSLQMPLDMLFSAEGNIKFYQLFEGVVLFLPVPVSYLLLYYGAPISSAFLTLVIFETISIFGVIILANKICKMPIKAYIRRVLGPCLLMFAPVLLAYIFINLFINTFLIKILIIALTIVVITCFLYFLGLTNDEKQIVHSLIINRKRK